MLFIIAIFNIDRRWRIWWGLVVCVFVERGGGWGWGVVSDGAGEGEGKVVELEVA